MDKIRIRQNYEDYERVKNAFKSFIHALVWESADICEGMDEREVNSHIQRFCDNKGERVIAKCNEDVSTFLTELYPRYDVIYITYDNNFKHKDEEVYHIDDLTCAIEKAMHFYRETKSPYTAIKIYDNIERKYIVRIQT
jgi:hypothetical protein